MTKDPLYKPREVNKQPFSVHQIGIDLMGSDTPPEVLCKTILHFAPELDPSVHLTLIGSPALQKSIDPQKNSNVSFLAADEEIFMSDDPLLAVRRKKDSSIHKGLRLLRDRKIDAFISSGNTGALIATAKMTLPTLPGIKRPALLTLLPAKNKEIAVLDVGANASCKAEHLVQFAFMGLSYQKSRGINAPKIGLLNIGSESTKGTPTLREVYQQLEKLNQQQPGTFVGNIEGRDVFTADIDILVTDGFTGNVFLKTSEGIASIILQQLTDELFKECPPPARALLSLLKHRLDYAEYPGALLCGVEGVVIKCHGNTTPLAAVISIKEAFRLLKHGFLDRIRAQLDTPL